MKFRLLSIRPWLVPWILSVCAMLPAAGEESLSASFSGKLVILQGNRMVAHQPEREPAYYAFYFAAGWCGPCRKFTPDLIEFYHSIPQPDRVFEVIFVSSDETEGKMETYMAKSQMPWPAIRFRETKRLDQILRFKGRGLPCLVLVDRQGNVVADSYVDGQYLGPAPVMRKMAELSR